jgi:hypothetical protein
MNEEVQAVIKRRSAGLFYAGGHKWVEDVHCAKPFSTVGRAVDAIKEDGIWDCSEILLRLGNGTQYNIPLGDRTLA